MRRVGRPLNATSNTTQGRLETQIFTWEEFDDMRLLKKSAISSWSPSYSSRPSIKRPSFRDEGTSPTKRRKAFFKARIDHFQSFISFLARDNEYSAHSSGN